MTTLTATLERFEILNAASEAERKEIFGDSGFLDYGSDAARKMLDQPRPKYDQMVAFLNSLGDLHVFALTALMYSGRDKQLDVVNYWKELASRFPKDKAIMKLLEKTPRIEYIQSAIQQGSLTQTDVNNLPLLLTYA